MTEDERERGEIRGEMKEGSDSCRGKERWQDDADG